MSTLHNAISIIKADYSNKLDIIIYHILANFLIKYDMDRG
jgi:hypothetical protein